MSDQRHRVTAPLGWWVQALVLPVCWLALLAVVWLIVGAA